MVVNRENQELNERMSTSPYKAKARRRSECCEGSAPMPSCDPAEKSSDYGKLNQWTTGDGKQFFPAGVTKQQLPPGAFEIHHSQHRGLYFQKISVRTEGLLRFPQTNSERVLKEIETFWDRENLFKDHSINYKRGIILWGPSGSGKTCTVNLIMEDVINRDGVVIKFTSPGMFLEGMRVLREIQPETPIVVLMEDIDSIIEHHEESLVLNILDGVESVQKVVYLATTNYPELLGPRIINRPSRFDKRFKIPHPNAESRTMYFNYLCGNRKPEELKIDIKRWVKDTEDFSLAHLKELFVAVIILGDDYSEALENLQLMKENISSKEDVEKMMGFGAAYLGA